MSNLSPQAQAVDRAIADRIQLLGEIAPSRQVAAAALRAVMQNTICIDDYGDEYINPNDILKIIKELEQF